jgi:hypothetical protein
MHEYWERRLDEARKINGRIEAELEVALASAGPEAAEPVRAVIGAAAAPKRRLSTAARRASAWQEQRRAEDGVERVEIVTPQSPHQLQITIFPSDWGTAPAAPVALAEPALARRVVGPLWYRGLIAGMYALASNFVLYTGLVAVGAVDRIADPDSLPMVLAVTSVLCALTGTAAFGVLRSWFARPDTPFRLMTAAALLVLLVAFVVTPGATYLGAIVAVVMTSMSLGSELVSD